MNWCVCGKYGGARDKILDNGIMHTEESCGPVQLYELEEAKREIERLNAEVAALRKLLAEVGLIQEHYPRCATGCLSLTPL